MSTCPSCKSENVPGSRWCSICHTNVINTAIGRLASPGKRFGAYILDGIIPVFALFMITGISAGIGASAGGGDGGAALGAGFGVILLLAYSIFAFVLFTKGTTPGKKMLGMRVIKEDGNPVGFFRMFFREVIGKFISGLIFSLGYLWILFDRDNQGWHDKLMSTYVIN